MKIVILGGAGYIGSTLTNLLLNEGFHVHVVDNFWKGSFDTLLPFVTNNNFSFSFGDVTNPEDMKKQLVNADFIIELASLVGFPISKKYPELARITSVEGMKNVLLHRPKHCPVLFSSTGSVYGEVLDGIATEETSANPLSIYGKYKLEAEKICLNEEDTIVYRFATLFGMGFSTTRVNLLLNDFCWQAVVNKSIVLFQSHFKRNFIHNLDICKFILYTINNYKLMLSQNRLYNVGNESLNYSKLELCNEILKQIDFHLTLAETHQDEDGRNYSFSSKRAYDTGWRPEIDIQTGIKELIKAVPLMTPWNKYN